MRPWSTAFVVACFIAAAVATTNVAPAVSTVTASTGDSFTYNPALPVPNRVLNIPLDLAPTQNTPVAIVVAGTGTAFATGNAARLSILPAFCVDCAGTGGGACVLPTADSDTSDAAAATATGFSFTFPDGAAGTVGLDDLSSAFGQNNFGTRGRMCFQITTPATGFTTVDLGFLVVSYNCAGTPTCDVNLINDVNDPANEFSRWLTGDQIAQLLTETTECNVGTGAAVCTCYNARSTIACCQGKQYDTTLFKCCVNGNIVNLNDACPCTSDTQCGQNEPLCCVQTKYPELRNSSTGVLTNTTGQCYNAAVHRCCDTGFRYDPGQDQCCTINGIQSLNVPCPCTLDVHCAGGQAADQRTNNFICCSQTNPVPAEATSCSIYSNFPSGTGPFAAQRCTGQCIDPTYQICCNGNACIKEYERCCNTTCCNTFVGACHRVQKDIAGQRFNNLNIALNSNDPNSVTVVFERCTTIEQMTPIRAFWIFVLPTAFLAATFLALAVALVFANKAAVRVFSWVERFIVFFAVILTLLACPFYFSPLYKYGAVIAGISFWAIITAATRVRWINAVAIGALIFLQIYLYDPFHGSAYFNLAYWRIWIESPFAGATDPRSNGILHTTRMMFPNVTTTNQAQWCSRYYDYFIYDPELRAPLRNDNPLRTTFGYCSRGWVMALYLLAGFIFIASLFLLLLAIIALVSRFRKELLEPVELEVRAVQDFAPVY